MMFSREHHKSVITVLNALATDYFQARQCYFGGGTLLALGFGEYRESVDIDFLISDTEAIRALRADLRKDDYSVLFASTNSSIALNPQQPRVTRDKVLFAAQPHDTPIKVEILFEGRITLDNPRQLPFTEMPCLALRDAIAEKLLANADRGLDSAYFAKDLIDLAIAISDIELLESAMEKIHAAEKGYDVPAPLRRSVETFAAKQEFRRQCYAQLQVSSPVDIVDGIVRAAAGAGSLSRGQAMHHLGQQLGQAR